MRLIRILVAIVRGWLSLREIIRGEVGATVLYRVSAVRAEGIPTVRRIEV